MNKTVIVVGAVALGAAVFLLARPKREEIASPQLDPGWARHRGMPPIARSSAGGLATVRGGFAGSGAGIRMPSEQEPRVQDAKGYPYKGDERPSQFAQGYWRGPGMAPIGYSPIDYGPAPVRIPRLWRDSIRYWDGVAQRGYTQQNYRVFLFHLRPSMPTRGYRSVSGVLYNGGPTASRVRIPAIFVPTSAS